MIALSVVYLFLGTPWGLLPIYGTAWIIVFALAIRHLAFGSRQMHSAMIQLHKDLEEAGQVQGAPHRIGEPGEVGEALGHAYQHVQLLLQERDRIAAGVVLISAAGALNANLFAFLFGSILTVTRGDLLLVAILGVVGLALIGALYRPLVAVALDEEAARVSGVPVALLNVLLAGLAGVTIAISMRIVGILLIAALMVLPVIAASRIAWSIRSTIVLSTAIGLGSVFAGLTLAYYANLAPGGAIVLTAAAGFVLASGAAVLRTVFA